MIIRNNDNNIDNNDTNNNDNNDNTNRWQDHLFPNGMPPGVVMGLH